MHATPAHPTATTHARDLQIDSLGVLGEDIVTALLGQAMNPLQGESLAAVTQKALAKLWRKGQQRPRRARKPLKVLYPLLLTGSSKPDLVLVDENCKIQFVIENKIRAAGHRRDSGKLQIDAYVGDAGTQWQAGLSKSPDVRYILLVARRGATVEDFYTDATSRMKWSVVPYEDLSANVSTSGLTFEERCFWAGLRTELSRACDRFSFPPVDVVDASRVLVAAAKKFPSSDESSLARRVIAYVSGLDAARNSQHFKTRTQALSQLTQGSCFEYRPSRYANPWVRHVLEGYGLEIGFGVPRPLETGQAKLLVRGEPAPGPVGRVYVHANTATGRRLATRLPGPGDDSGLLRYVKYPPHDRKVGNLAPVGFWGFHPLKEDAGTSHAGEDGIAAAYRSVLEDLVKELLEIL